MPENPTLKQRQRAVHAMWADPAAIAFCEERAGLTFLQFEAFTLQRVGGRSRREIADLQGNGATNISRLVRDAETKIKAARGQRLSDADAPLSVVTALTQRPRRSDIQKPVDIESLRGLPVLGLFRHAA